MSEDASACAGGGNGAACQQAHFGHHLQESVGHLSETAADGRSEVGVGGLELGMLPAQRNANCVPGVEGYRERTPFLISTGRAPTTTSSFRGHRFQPVVTLMAEEIPVGKEKLQNNTEESPNPPGVTTSSISIGGGEKALGMSLDL